MVFHQKLFSLKCGLLTFESDWNPPLGSPLEKALNAGNPEGGSTLPA
jgi:hypothetical protein